MRTYAQYIWLQAPNDAFQTTIPRSDDVCIVFELWRTEKRYIFTTNREFFGSLGEWTD